MTPPIQVLVSSSIEGLALNVLLPTCRIDLSDECFQVAHTRCCSLDAINHAHHAVVVSMNPGRHVAIMNAQAAWRKRIEGNDGVILVEPEMPLGDMVAWAAKPLHSKLATTGNLVINCQSTRESDIGSSVAGRILNEASCRGLGFTVGQSGLVGAIQALETALVLGRNDHFSGSTLICAGDRWIDIYPRILGNWASLSDGVAVAAFTIKSRLNPNLWVINDRVSAHMLLTDSSSEGFESDSHDELIDKLSAFIDVAQTQRRGSLAIVAPSICGVLGERVTASLVSRYPFVAVGAVSARSHFGAANALINLHRLFVRYRHYPLEVAPSGYLIWDCDPSGLFGAMIVDRCAFESTTSGDSIESLT